MIPLGRDIGYLLGTKDEKMHLWMQLIFDNLSYLMGLHNGGRRTRPPNRACGGCCARSGSKEALTYIRGCPSPAST